MCRLANDMISLCCGLTIKYKNLWCNDVTSRDRLKILNILHSSKGVYLHVTEYNFLWQLGVNPRGFSAICGPER